MSHEDEFIQKYVAEWTPVTAERLQGIPEEYHQMIRHLERQWFEVSCRNMSDTVSQVTNRYQFAKSYKISKQAFERRLADPQEWDYPDAPPELGRLARELFEENAKRVLGAMRIWWGSKWPIQWPSDGSLPDVEKMILKCADAGPGGGCAGATVVLLMLSGLVILRLLTV